MKPKEPTREEDATFPLGLNPDTGSLNIVESDEDDDEDSEADEA